MAALEAFLLTRQWADRRDGLRLEFWGASPEGPVRLGHPAQESVFFVDRATEVRAGRRAPVALTDLRGRAVDAVYFDHQRALRAERDAVRGRGGRTLEGDVAPHDRFLMERFVTGGVRITGEPRQRKGFLDFSAPRIEPSEYVPDLAVLSLDIETDGFDGPLLSIATAGAGGDHVFMRGDGPATRGVHYHPDEAALLTAFLAHVTGTDPDVLVGWNVVEFDLRRLEERADAHGIPLTLGRAGERATVLAPRRPQQPPIARVPGRVVLDGVATLRSATFSFESYRLEDVARELLGRGKRIAPTGDPMAEIRRLFDEDKPGLAAYNLEDCRLVLDVFDRTDLLGFAVERQSLTGLPMDRQGGSVAAFDHLYLPRLHREGHVAPDVGDSDEVVSSPGGYVLDSTPGLYRNVLVLDFKSLYPSIIRTFAIDPLGLAFPGEDPIPGFDDAHFARTRHLLPRLIETLWSARDDAKRRGDEARSRVLKILMNSFYGVLGTPGCRFSSPKLASSITRRGHEIITESRDWIEERGHRVIYGDTDSLFVHVGDDRTEPECRRVGSDLAAALNEAWRQRLRERFAIESHLELEFETHYLRFLMPTIRGSDRGTKKRYAGSVRTADGGTEIVFKGLEAVRTDWTPLARRLQRELFRRVFHDEPWEDWLRELADAVRRGDLDDELVYRKRIRRSLDDYERNVPPHIQAARKLERPGREIAYVVTAQGAEPAELPHGPLDHEHYLRRQLAPAADGLLSHLGTSFEAVAGTQLRLF